ncbi:winged helix-turn-helix domain-containing protein [Paraburkholderia sp.]|uniref:winged helix-turn-helix domain-containing protein n=1 Tax=Paraburkholderia sp. TaxID=1926495 RepID=UPI0023A4BD4A|nr:winged helix-turn-helix domain-containing protein [Paraburkholderia sp.]MDE1179074.1 winged helix-turn-helix domain-containing protein [Paraburkholderia sp.]
MPTHLLVVDEDAELGHALRRYLTNPALEVHVLHDVRALAYRVERDRPDMIVLTPMPKTGVGGLSALRRLRESGDETPVVLLTGTANDDERIVGLDSGADDCVAKTCDPRELLARIQAVLRRNRPAPPASVPQVRLPFRFGRFTLDFQARALTLDNQPMALSAGEFALLTIFVNAPMCTLSRDRLLKTMLGPEYDVSDRGVDVRVWRLRRILERDPSSPRLIQTVRGRGYMFVPDGERGLASIA